MATEPRTEAGKRLLTHGDPSRRGLLAGNGYIDDDILREGILAIEAEARADGEAASVGPSLPTAEWARLRGVDDVARLLVSGWDNGFPVIDGDNEPDLIARLRALTADPAYEPFSAAALSAASVEPAGLDAAWSEAEAALPEPGIVQLTGTTTGIADPYIAIALDQFAGRPLGGPCNGSTPAAALQALAAKLRAEAPDAGAATR